MKIKEIKGISKDLMELGESMNPLRYIWIKNEYEINLITGKLNIREKDTITEFLESKSRWFNNRIIRLNGKLADFSKAKITLIGNKEQLEIIYKDKKFSEEKSYINEQKKLREQISKLKSFKIKYK